ncbi:MAG TPA: hypothetical protein VHK63_04560 [Candidatus Limnocylindria bacterium]|nr:hypothetical protein [Candidatus Limnocylindria bacterium]
MAAGELAPVLPTSGPTWYALFKAILDLVQWAIGPARLAGFRRGGVWRAS